MTLRITSQLFVAVVINCWVLLRMTSAFQTADNPPHISGLVDSSLTYIGEADGKLYFVALELDVNWSDASDYCRSANLLLASIQTENQRQLLQAFLPQGHSFWTGMREVRKGRSAYVWNDTEVAIDTSVLKSWYYAIDHKPYQYCGVFVAFGETANPVMFIDPCSYTRRFLCHGEI